ncbi:hypothetical protein GXW74_10760 [Roseomonas eburnea]|uniref:Lysine-specific metallo-endopeptidase domain-containing protein n=1 Tax=Neoroseomonas eburnea TaxID=1346889 RepID=A0A9X9XB82_9PROT|nr:M35 family metallo-endopeptidase [Neoroseomonas eburnea]MBR0680968.1 hypothetical protein [Neoroseomonas eburnea]
MRRKPTAPPTPRWPITAALLLLLAAPALADLPTDKPPPLERNERVLQVELPTSKPPPLERGPADIPGPLCTVEHRPVLDEALAEARLRIAEAVRLVREEPEHPHIRRWFGDAPRKGIRITLELTAQRLASTEGLDIRCNDPASCPGGRFAYARERDLVLGVCPPFFRARMDGTDSRWGILIHEATHIAANTRDHVYRPNGALALAKEDGMRAAENADNFEYFVETLPR